MRKTREEIADIILNKRDSRHQPSRWLRRMSLDMNEFYPFGVRWLHDAKFYAVLWKIAHDDKLGGVPAVERYLDICAEFLAAAKVWGGQQLCEIDDEMEELVRNILTNSSIYDDDELLMSVAETITDEEMTMFSAGGQVKFMKDTIYSVMQSPNAVMYIITWLRSIGSEHVSLEGKYFAKAGAFPTVKEKTLQDSIPWSRQLTNDGVQYRLYVNERDKTHPGRFNSHSSIIDEEQVYKEISDGASLIVLEEAYELDGIHALRNFITVFGADNSFPEREVYVVHNSVDSVIAKVQEFVDEFENDGIYPRVIANSIKEDGIHIHTSSEGVHTYVTLDAAHKGFSTSFFETNNFDIEIQKKRFVASRLADLPTQLSNKVAYAVDMHLGGDDYGGNMDEWLAQQARKEVDYRAQREAGMIPLDKSEGFLGFMEREAERFGHGGSKRFMDNKVVFSDDPACKEALVRAVTFGKLSEEEYTSIHESDMMYEYSMINYAGFAGNKNDLTTNISEMVKLLNRSLNEGLRECQVPSVVGGTRGQFENILCVYQEMLREQGYDIIIDEVLNGGVPTEDAFA